MKTATQFLLLLLPTTLQLVSTLTEVCFFHNTTTEGAYIQCGDLPTAEQLTQYAEHLEIESIQIGWNTSIPLLDYGLFTKLDKLKTLLLNGANIEKIGTRAFYGLEQLEELSLYNNKISEIHPDMFTQLYILRSLNLGQNKIATLEENAFSSLYQLEKLILRWNYIENITKATFYGLRGLRVLDLRGNQISALLGDVFEEFYFLESLDLSFNSLKELPEILLSNQRNLLVFTVESNGIKSLPYNLFKNTVHLQFLDVSNNLLTHFQESILNNTVVETLKFSRNHISAINASSLIMKAQWLEEVDLNFNPWKCDALKEVLQEFEKSQVYVELGTDIESKHHVNGIACKH